MQLPQSVVAKITLLEHSFEYICLPSVSLHYLLVLGLNALPYSSASDYRDVFTQSVTPDPIANLLFCPTSSS